MKRLSREALGDDFKVIIQEDGGKSVRNMISTQRNTAPPAPCRRPKCLPCLSTEQSTTLPGSSGCWTSSSTYKISCLPCKQSGRLTQYWGETGQTSFSRGFSHWTGLEQRSKSSVLHNHAVEAHGGRAHALQPRDFAMEVVKAHTYIKHIQTSPQMSRDD